MKNKTLNFAIVASIIIHLFFLSLSYENKQQDNRKNLAEKKRDKKVNIIKLEMMKTKQIVQTAESINKEVVKDSYLSEKNNTFDRQTVAAVVDKFRVSKGTANVESPKKTPQKSAGKKTLAKLGIGLPEVIKKPTTESKDETLLREVSSLASASNDYIKDVPLSDMSRFNTTEYKYFGFYQRIRGQLEQHWGTTLKEKAKRIYKAGRKIASESDFITNIEVALDFEGKIKGIKIIGSSGVKELDDAAIESFNKAGPFPNPPKDLVTNGVAVIKWGFVVKS